jgi:excisionase family DNA binding protein
MAFESTAAFLESYADESRRLLKYPEAAHYLGVCERTLATLKAAGDLPFVQIGKSVRFDRRDLDAFIASQRS